MADPTPPSDIPDPASATPATPAPKPGPGPVGGPKRIRSMPDRPANVRPPGTIRSMPVQTRAAARPPGTYAASFGTERSWSRGMGILWALFAATMLMEALNAAFYLLAGKIAWPPNSLLDINGTHLVLPIEAGRLVLVCTFFIGLWAGWGWLRYLLATVDFLSGLWLAIGMIASYHAAPKFRAIHEADVPVYSHIESFPKVALAILYLGTAAYVIFSIDVQEFITHRRARGRVWSALLVTVASYGCMVLILGAQPIYNSWLHTQRLGAMAFGEDTLRKMSDQWAANSIDERIDPVFAKQFTPEGRKATFANFKDLGQLHDARPVPLMVLTTVQSQPLQNIVPAPADIGTRVTRDENGFELVSRYNTTGSEFEHGEVKFGFDLVRDLFGTWRVAGLDAVPIRIDRPHKAAPTPSLDASPAPAAPGDPAASPALSAIPSPTASTVTTDAAAPTPAGSPSPAGTAAPSPAASPAATVAPPPAPSAAPAAIPAATPVPSTGG